MIRIGSLIAAAVVAAASAGIARAQQPRPATHTYTRDIPEALAAEAKVSEGMASATALARVPTGRIWSVELERENGTLMYSYDIKVPGKSGVEEVNVDALDGSVIAVEHESARSEAREKKAEMTGGRAKKPAAKKKP